jgi:hypothetical protein
MIGGTGHEAYVKNLDAPLNQRFVVMNVGQPIIDYETNDLVGYQANYVATAVVTNPGPVSKTVLTEGAREALRGDRLISQEGDAPLTFTPHAPTTRVDARIIAIADEATEVGQYQVEVIHDVWSRRPFGKNPLSEYVELPHERTGTLIVFKVFDRVSYALIIGARGPIQVADRAYTP